MVKTVCGPVGEKMKILVTSADYPRPDGSVALAYIHVRNEYYLKHGIDVTVLNFAANEGYELDGIRVITLSEYAASHESYDILVLHAPNIRNHWRFLKKYGSRFARKVFFFHGHEIRKINIAYPQPFAYMQGKKISPMAQDCYDIFKLYLWKKYFENNLAGVRLVFVSKYLYGEFLRFTGISEKLVKDRYHIIHNSVAKDFEEISYDTSTAKEYDFVTVRNNLDGSNYCADVVNNLAFANPDLKFLLVGRGEFFNHFKKAPNITWFDKVLTHREMADLFNKSRCAILPTRLDAQGVVACEMATFGIPLVTSDIPICHEILGGFENVAFIDNEKSGLNLVPILEDVTRCVSKEKNTKYFSAETVKKEIALFEALTSYS